MQFVIPGAPSAQERNQQTLVWGTKNRSNERFFYCIVHRTMQFVIPGAPSAQERNQQTLVWGTKNRSNERFFIKSALANHPRNNNPM